jgi:hypothetical protein
MGLALLVGGIAVLATYAFDRDDDGYFNSDRKQLESDTYAITTQKSADALPSAGEAALQERDELAWWTTAVGPRPQGRGGRRFARFVRRARSLTRGGATRRRGR